MILAHHASLLVRLDDLAQLGEVEAPVERAAFLAQVPELVGYGLADRVAHFVPRPAQLLQFSRDGDHAFRLVGRQLALDDGVDRDVHPRANPLTKRTSLEGDQRVFLQSCRQSQSDGLFRSPKGALFKVHGPEAVGIPGAQVFTGCGNAKNAGSPGSRRRVLTQGLPVLDV